VVSKLGSNRFDCEMIRILFSIAQPLRMLPDRIVTGHEYRAAPLQNQDTVVLR